MNVFRLVLCLAGLTAYLIARQSLPEATTPQTAPSGNASLPHPTPAAGCKHASEHINQAACDAASATNPDKSAHSSAEAKLP